MSDPYAASLLAQRNRRQQEADADLAGMFSPPERLGETFDPEQDGERLATNTAKVYQLLRGGKACTVEELRRVGGSSGDRRARDLRDPRFGSLPVTVTRAHGGFWVYQLVMTDAQRERADALLLGGS